MAFPRSRCVREIEQPDTWVCAAGRRCMSSAITMFPISYSVCGIGSNADHEQTPPESKVVEENPHKGDAMHNNNVASEDGFMGLK